MALEEIGWSVETFFSAYTNWVKDSRDFIPTESGGRYSYGTRYINLDISSGILPCKEQEFIQTVSDTFEKVEVSSSTENRIGMTFLNGKFSQCMLDFFDRGTYGRIYKTVLRRPFSFAHTYTPAICKTIRQSVKTVDRVSSFLIESFIHSVLSTSSTPVPSFTTKVLYVAEETRSFLNPVLFTEIADGTFEKPPNRQIFKTLLGQMARALKYLQSRYKFVHGDLRLGNIVYKVVPESIDRYTTDDESEFGISNCGFHFLMIDFGMSTIQYEGKNISTNTLYSIRKIDELVFPNSCDLSLLLASCYERFKSNRRRICKLLTFPNEKLPLPHVFDFGMDMYFVCAECHNPLTTPDAILGFLKTRSNTTF